MKVAVLGAGVIGMTSAWYLAKAGHEVVVLDRQQGPALETSYANAGEISPGYASPWAAPGLPQKAIRWLLTRHSPLILSPRIDGDMLRWIIATLRNCTPQHYSTNKSRMIRLAEFSRDCLIELRAETGIVYDEGMKGTLQVLRTQKQMNQIAKDAEVLRDAGIPFEVLDPAGCVLAEPGLASARHKIAGGLRLPNDETGDCYKFTNGVAELASSHGVTLQYDTTVLAVEVESGRITGVRTNRGTIIADRYVLALGSHSAALIRPLGIRLPVYPVKGYSITMPVVKGDLAPISTLMDETYKVAITRLGDRIRVGGLAEISGYTATLANRPRTTLAHSFNDLFPGAGESQLATYWCGLRPMTPDGTPIVGPTAFDNLFLNTGHGTLGWTMACGSGHLIADIITGRSSDIEASEFSIARYGKP